MTTKKRKRTIDEASSVHNLMPPKSKPARRKRSRAQKVTDQPETMDQVETEPITPKRGRRGHPRRSKRQLPPAGAFDSALGLVNDLDPEIYQLTPTAAKTLLPMDKMSILVRVWLQNLGALKNANAIVRMINHHLPSSFNVWYHLRDHEKASLQFEPVILLDHLTKQHDALTRRLAEVNTPADSLMTGLNADDGELPGTEAVQRLHQTIGLQLQLHADKLGEEQNLIINFHESPDAPVDEGISEVELAHCKEIGQNSLDGSTSPRKPASAVPDQNQPLWTLSDRLGPRHGQSSMDHQPPSPSTFDPSNSSFPASSSIYDRRQILANHFAHPIHMTDFQRQQQACYHSFAALDLEESSPVDDAKLAGPERKAMESKTKDKSRKYRTRKRDATGPNNEAVEEDSTKERKPMTKNQAANEAVKESANETQEVQVTDVQSNRPKPEAIPRPAPDPRYLLDSQQPSSTRQTPQPLLIVCDLNDTLVKRLTKSGTKLTRRPGLDAFLAYVFAHHRFMLWTSARPENMQRCLGTLLNPQQQRECVAAWGRNTLGLTNWQYVEKVQVYKRLETVFTSGNVQRTYPTGSVDPGRVGGGWGVHNTLLVDDSAEKGAAQPYNLLNVDSMGRAKDKTLIELIGYLEQIKYCDDVRPYVKTNPFHAGQGWDRNISPRLHQELLDLIREGENAGPQSGSWRNPPGASSFTPATTQDPGLSPQSQHAGRSSKLNPTSPPFNPIPASSRFNAINAAFRNN